MNGYPKTPEAAIATYTATLARDYRPIAPMTPPPLAAAQCGEPKQFPRDTPKPRPYAKRARELCTATNHDDVWFCQMCWGLEQRLTPISEIPALRELIAEESLTWKVQVPDA